MHENFTIALGICAFAAFATLLGSLVLFRAKGENPRLLAFGLAFAGGAMVYISLAEILVKAQLSFTAVYDDKTGYALATGAFFCGVLLVAALDRFLPNPHEGLDSGKFEEQTKTHAARIGLMAAIAITAHNIPEGMATFFAALDDPSIGFPLAVAIAIHNIPEGVGIAIPVYFATQSKIKAIGACGLSALAEPFGALLGYALLGPYLTGAVYGWIFGIIAGVMVFLALDELLPAAKKYAKGHETVYGMVAGMGALALSLVLLR
ncbi:MAG: zinc transporter ZupT [Micavibrio sp.]